MSKVQKGRDYSDMLIWAAGLVGMIRYAAAFLSSDLGEIVGTPSEIVTILLGVSGFAMGLLATFGATYLFDGWRKKMPSTGQTWPFKFIVLTIFVVLIFISELAILVPFTVSRMGHISMNETLQGGVWWWSFAVNAMPLLLIAGVSVGNQVVMVSVESSEKVSEPERKVSENFPNDWRKVLPYLSASEILEISRMSTANIKAKYHLKTAKTAQNWRGYAQVEVQKMESVK